MSSDVPLQCMQTFSVLRVFLGGQFCHDALQLPLRLTLGEVTHLVVLRGNFHQPRTGGKQTLVTKPSPQRLLVGRRRLGHIHTASAAVLILKCTRSRQGTGQVGAIKPVLYFYKTPDITDVDSSLCCQHQKQQHKGKMLTLSFNYKTALAPYGTLESNWTCCVDISCSLRCRLSILKS